MLGLAGKYLNVRNNEGTNHGYGFVGTQLKQFKSQAKEFFDVNMIHIMMGDFNDAQASQAAATL